MAMPILSTQSLLVRLSFYVCTSLICFGCSHVLIGLLIIALIMFMYVYFAGAVDENGRKPFYAEECASMLAVTFSSGGNKLRSIVSLA